ncbi:hypothetical protein OEA41_004551 [Lepraria neglecta]|uniref:Uncharacterized protein n=1 Tax=Lepraria neglecta TaxID=209136 RepID=A0AAD9YYT8_9LECA|nr:hypothetical protein OEA41_004551 [Lepraria neglecta]
MGLDFKEHEYFHAYRPRWPLEFAAIAAELASDLAFNNVSFISIEHVGSTSVPGLAAKPIIDILLVIAADEFHEIKRLQIMETLGWARRPGQGGYSNDTGEGGVKGRWSLKLNGVEPFKSLHVVPERGIPHRSCLALRQTLRKEEELRREYETVKIEVAAKREQEDVAQYSIRKSGIIRKILRKAGWSDEEVDEKVAFVQPREPKYLEL